MRIWNSWFCVSRKDVVIKNKHDILEIVVHVKWCVYQDTPPLRKKQRELWWRLCGWEVARSCHHAPRVDPHTIHYPFWDRKKMFETQIKSCWHSWLTFPLTYVIRFRQLVIICKHKTEHKWASAEECTGKYLFFPRPLKRLIRHVSLSSWHGTSFFLFFTTDHNQRSLSPLLVKSENKSQQVI